MVSDDINLHPYSVVTAGAWAGKPLRGMVGLPTTDNRLAPTLYD